MAFLKLERQMFPSIDSRAETVRLVVVNHESAAVVEWKVTRSYRAHDLAL